MPISVTCPCGHLFNAPDELAGKTVKCTACHGLLEIPDPHQHHHGQSNGFEEMMEDAGLVAGPKCPACGAAIAPNAVLCIECGMNFELGKQVRGVRRHGGPGGHSLEAERLLAQAEDELGEGPAKSEDQYGHESSAWGLTLVMLAVAAAVVAAGVAFFNYMENKSDSDDEAAVVRPIDHWPV